MKSIKVKKILAAALAASMVMASAVTVCASGGSDTAGPGTGSSESSGAPVTYEETMSKTADAPVSVAGVTVKTSVAGVYAAEKVQGVAVTTPLADVRASLGLSGSQKPVIIIYDTDETKSSRAMASINAAAEAIGGTVVTSLNIDLGAKENGKWVALSNGSVGLVTGLPKGADTSREYCAICVQPGGIITILEDQDQNPATVAFEVQAGLGTYAITAK